MDWNRAVCHTQLRAHWQATQLNHRALGEPIADDMINLRGLVSAPLSPRERGRFWVAGAGIPSEDATNLDKEEERIVNQPNPIEMQNYLSGVDYPCGRDQLIEHARGQGADEATLDHLRQIPDRNYDGPDAVSAEFSATAR